MTFAAVDLLAVGSVVAPVAVAFVAYLVAVRRLSGSIGKSEATDLWKESSSIREWSATRIGQLEERIASVEKANGNLAAENRSLTQRVRDLSDTCSELRQKIGVLTADLKIARQRVAELENHAGGNGG